MNKSNQVFLGEFEIGLKQQHHSTHNEIWTQDSNSVIFAFVLTKDGEKKIVDAIMLLIVLPNETKVILQGVYDTEKEMYVTEHFDTSAITNKAKQRAFGYLYGEAEDGTKGYDIGSFSFFVGTSAIDKKLEQAKSIYVPKFEALYEKLKNLGITDAPSDTEMYGRKNGNWEKITGVTEGRVKEIAEEVVEELDIKDGFSPIIDLTPITNGTKVTITDKNKTKSIDILDGPKGEKGAKGKSAFETAKEAGYTGTEAEFYAVLASLSTQRGGEPDIVIDEEALMPWKYNNEDVYRRTRRLNLGVALAEVVSTISTEWKEVIRWQAIANQAANNPTQAVAVGGIGDSGGGATAALPYSIGGFFRYPQGQFVCRPFSARTGYVVTVTVYYTKK